jgi:hypothetical protein
MNLGIYLIQSGGSRPQDPPLALLTNDAALTQFLSALDWYIGEVESAKFPIANLRLGYAGIAGPSKFGTLIGKRNGARQCPLSPRIPHLERRRCPCGNSPWQNTTG